jgi:hypothetical protein
MLPWKGNLLLCRRPILVTDSEMLARIYSYLVFESLSILGRCSMNMNIVAPKMGDAQMAIFSEIPLDILIEFQ